MCKKLQLQIEHCKKKVNLPLAVMSMSYTKKLFMLMYGEEAWNKIERFGFPVEKRVEINRDLKVTVLVKE